MAINLRFSNGDLMNLREFPFNEPHEENAEFLAYKATQMIAMLNEIYKRTKSELINLFTLNEANLIVSAFTSTGYSYFISDKASLKMSIESACYYENAHQVFGVDKEVLMEKLDKLTEFQAFTVIRMAYEFLYKKNRSCENFVSMLREIFNIESIESKSA